MPGDSIDNMDNEHLVKLCQAGDRKALGLLYETYLPPMRKVVEYYVRDRAAVWDILHDGFIIAFSSVGALRQPERLEAWLTSIMKNLALRYLKKSAVLSPLPPSEVSDRQEEEDNAEFTWEELQRIISRLPEGYGKVFRLAVFGGLSHKEIGTMLGIAPHSSSSQLFHAKAMLRRMIRQYRIEVGVISLFVALLALWYLLPDKEELPQSSPVLSSNEGGKPSAAPVQPDTVRGEKSDSTDASPAAKPSVAPFFRMVTAPPEAAQEHIAEAPAVRADSVPAMAADSVVQNDTIRDIVRPFYPEVDFAETEIPVRHSNEETADWGIALAYSGALGQNLSRSTLDFNSNNVTVEDIDHKMPLIIGVSLSKTLTERWSLETGVRYSFMESDYHVYGTGPEQRINQRIHYFGIPLKVNYRIFTVGGFSLYGQGGGALDIPLRGRQTILMNSATGWRTERKRIHAPLQWSVGVGLGLQYRFTPTLSIFAEPSVNYYFNPGGEIKTIRQDKRFDFSIPLGLRFSW